jgi:hypothetical protein
LIEESRTNLLLYSADFANAAWTKSDATITSNTIVSPDSTLTGDKIVPNSGQTGAALIAQSISKSATATTYAYSCYAKAGEFTSFRLLFRDAANSANRCEATYNASTGATSGVTNAGTFSGAAASMTAVGNGWYHCVLIATTSTETSVSARVTNAASGQTGDGYSGLYLWGAQLEAGAFPTSYIATGAATATRSADSASMTGTNFSSWVNNAEGTLYVEYINYTTATGSLFSFDDGTANNRLIAFTNLGITPAYRVVVGGVEQALAGLANITVGTVGKLSFGYQVNNFAGSANGAAVVTDLSGTLPTSLAVARIGVNVSGVAALNGTIKRIAYYPLRLTNAQLQALTG